MGRVQVAHDAEPGRWLVLLVVLLVGLTACGGAVVFEETTGSPADDGPPDVEGPGAGAPFALYTSDREGCGVEAPLSELEAVFMTNDSGFDLLHVVDLAFVDECTGLGGQHILARTIDGEREMWLGGHGCSFFDPELVDGALHPGVIRAIGLLDPRQTPEGACVAFPGETGTLSSDVTVEAVAVFATRDDALAFAAEHD